MEISRRRFIKQLTTATIASSVPLSSGCLTNSNEENGILISDALGRDIKIPKKIEKIMGVGPGALRLLSYLECTNKVVGVEEIEKNDVQGRLYIYAYPNLSKLPSIGPQHGGEAELIASQNPDIVFKTMATIKECNSLQNKINIPVVSLGYGDLVNTKQKLFENLNFLGTILDRKERANEVIQYIKTTIQNLNERTKDIKEENKPTVYVGGVNYKGSYGIEGTEPLYGPFKFVNANNVASGLGEEHIEVSKEKIIHDWDPEVIFVDEGGYQLAIEDLAGPEFREVSAVKEGNIHGVLPQSYYHHMHGTVLANSYYIGKVLYPDRFKDVDPEEKANEISENLLGKSVYNEIKEDFGGFKRIKNL